MRSLASLLVICFLCCLGSSTALGQPVDIQYSPAAPPVVGVPEVVAVPCYAGPRADSACLKQVLDMDPQYRAARARRTGGIVLTAVGSGVGVIALAAAWASYASRDIENLFSTHQNDYTGEKVVAIAGASLIVVSLAVGIPTIVSGSREMRFIRAQYLSRIPMPAISVGPQRASFGAVWRF
jgi:hypothetical protein